MPQRERDGEPSDRERCVHMLQAAREAVEFAHGRTREEFDSDGMLRRAIKDCVQEISEAAARTTDLGRARVPGLPWGKIVAMRHILVHAYFGVDWDTIWNVTQEHLPEVIRTLESALKDWEKEQSG